MRLSGAEIVLETLLEQGVNVIFGYPGGSAINIYDALWTYQDKLRHVLVAHEQGAAHAADGYSRATGRVGVCMATSGPGATNLVTGIATAYMDSIPMIAITANVSRDLLGRDSFQEIDITGLTVPITKHNYFVKNIDDIAPTIRKAFEVATSGRQGPVLIDIPKDVTIELSDYQPVGAYFKRLSPRPPSEQLEKLVELIGQSKKPLLFFGGGILCAGAEVLLQQFATKIDAPLVSSARGISAVPHDFPLFFGLAGMHGTPVANKAIAESDLLITIGARFSERVTGDKSKFSPNSVRVHIDIDASELGKNIVVDHQIVGDAAEVLETLLELVPSSTHGGWVEELDRYRLQVPLPSTRSKKWVDQRKVLCAIREIGGADTIIVTDVGQHQMITAQSYPFSVPRTFLSSLGLGTMGFGMGAAVGAQIGCPKRQVVLITGDGSFHMNMNELATAVTEELPIVIIVMNNSSLGMVRQWQTLFFEKHYSATTPNRQTDFVKLAEAMGAIGYRIEQNDDIVATLTKAFSAKKPVLVECVVDCNENVFPMIPPGMSASDALFGEGE